MAAGPGGARGPLRPAAIREQEKKAQLLLEVEDWDDQR